MSSGADTNPPTPTERAISKQEPSTKYGSTDILLFKNNTESQELTQPFRRSRKSSRKKVESLQSTSQIYQCVRCPQSFSRLNQLKCHAKIHSREKHNKYECNVCSSSFVTMKAFLTHRRYHGSHNFKCHLCHTEYNSHTTFKIHMRLHKGEKPYACRECGATFSQSGHLSIHKRTHTGEKPYTCDICNNNFKQISHLKTHVRTHTRDKPYRCNQCSSAFTQNSSLKRHKRVHTGEKPYNCPYCDMNFVVKSNMQRHLNTHTGERPFQCDLCPASFGQAIDLKRHKISHTGVKPFKCDLCKAAFSRKNNLKWHILTHSESAGFRCNICYVGFQTTGDVKAHMRNHAPPKPYTCDVCSASFRLTESLNRHKAIHTGERPLRLKTNKIGVKEGKIKPFNCLLCNASFCEKRNLKRHTFSVHNSIASFTNNSSDNGNGKSDFSRDVSKPETASSSVEENAEHVTEEPFATQHSSIPVSNSGPNVPQLIMQTIPNQEGINNVPHFFVAGPGQSPKPARPAGQCQNHSLHILTFVEGSYNQWQSWCFCDPPNILDSPTTQIIVPSTNETTTEHLTQILVTSPLQQPVPESAPQQVFLTVAPPPIAETGQQIFLSPGSFSQAIPPSPNIAALSLAPHPVDLQGTLLQSSNTTFIREVKSEGSHTVNFQGDISASSKVAVIKEVKSESKDWE